MKNLIQKTDDIGPVHIPERVDGIFPHLEARVLRRDLAQLTPALGGIEVAEKVNDLAAELIAPGAVIDRCNRRIGVFTSHITKGIEGGEFYIFILLPLHRLDSRL